MSVFWQAEVLMTFYEAIIKAQRQAQKKARVDSDSMFFVIWFDQDYLVIPESTYDRFLDVDFTIDDRAAAVWSDGVLVEVDSLLAV
jgi:hypothetical protein